MDDLISRQSVLNILLYFNAPRQLEMIKKLPSADVQPVVRGRWYEIAESDCSGYDPVLAGYDDPVVGYVCSACHEGYEKEVMGETEWNFCPNCGADMRGE